MEENREEVPYSKLLGSNKVLTEDEAKVRKQDTTAVAWVEINRSNFIFCVELHAINDTYFNCHYYRRLWRLWAEEPSEELRERTPWDKMDEMYE